jgi:ABC-type thiamine transport system substrate-binding protein
VTVTSNEVFTVLTLENNWNQWASMAKAKEWKDSDIASKWTTFRDKRKTQKKIVMTKTCQSPVMKTAYNDMLDAIMAGQHRALHDTISFLMR